MFPQKFHFSTTLVEAALSNFLKEFAVEIENPVPFFFKYLQNWKQEANFKCYLNLYVITFFSFSEIQYYEP